MTEADEGNNGLASAPSFIRVVRNLTKFQSASASLSQSSPSPLRGFPGRPRRDLRCPGAINLSGSFTITSQQAQNATGIADLTGTLNSVAVRYVIEFAGTADDNDHVLATLTSISATGAFIGTGSGTFDGTLNGQSAQWHRERHDQHVDWRRVQLQEPDRPGHDLEHVEARHPDPAGARSGSTSRRTT